MTEPEWATSADPLAMLRLVRERGRATDRKLRLFLAACCYQVGLPDDDAARFGREVAARLAEAGGVLGMKARVILPRGQVVLDCGASEPVGDPTLDRGSAPREDISLPWVLTTAIEQLSCSRDLFSCVAWTLDRFRHAGLSLARQADLLRELFAAPGQTNGAAAGWQSWEGGLLIALGECAYQEHAPAEGTLAPDRLAVLSDALEDANCTDGELLAHLRSPGPHFRGCWALDFVLGRE